MTKQQVISNFLIFHLETYGFTTVNRHCVYIVCSTNEGWFYKYSHNKHIDYTLALWRFMEDNFDEGMLVFLNDWTNNNQEILENILFIRKNY